MQKLVILLLRQLLVQQLNTQLAECFLCSDDEVNLLMQKEAKFNRKKKISRPQYFRFTFFNLLLSKEQ